MSKIKTMFRTRIEIPSTKIISGDVTFTEEAPVLRKGNAKGYFAAMPFGVREQELMGRRSTGRDTQPAAELGRKPLGAAVDPDMLKIEPMTIAKNEKSLNTRGFRGQSKTEAAEAVDTLLKWDPLRKVQGKDRKGLGGMQGQEGLTEKSKNVTNAAPERLYDFTRNADTLSASSIKIRTKKIQQMTV